MIDRKQVLDRAERRAHAARERLTSRLVEIQQRLDPQTLMIEAGRELRQRAGEWVNDSVDAARRNPAAAFATGATALAWLLRKPIARWIIRFFTEDRTVPSAEALTAQAISAAANRPPAPSSSRSEQHDDELQRKPTRRRRRPAPEGQGGGGA
ncbi:hypothetical protein ACMT1E_06865 [Sphingomonas flavalba]|uniref:hypothetical protein n=1 Tax=Sphingomonas flavalba TaxID=2559804 RepID=UPI0039E0BF9B